MDMHSALMHFGSCFQQQGMMVEQNSYCQYVINDSHAYSSSDHQEDDNTDNTGDEMPSETSGDQSQNIDMFRLEFAASQWSKLVLNAEGLFNKLMSNSALPANEQIMLKNQIEQWLCMKQEYEECIGDDSGSLQACTETTKRSLEKIEEVTETDEKTDESSSWNKLREKSCSSSESETFDDEDQSDLDSENPDFIDKLDVYMQQFKDETDDIVDSKKNDFLKVKNIPLISKPAGSNSTLSLIKVKPLRNTTSRRTSILPYSEMSNELVEFQKQISNSITEQKDEQQIHDISPVLSLNSEENNSNQKIPTNSVEQELASTKELVKLQNVTISAEHVNAIKILMICNEEKESQIRKIQFNLNLDHKQVEELQKTITVKEQFIDDMLKNCDARNSAKEKFQNKRSIFEEKYHNVEKELNYLLIHGDTEDECSYNEKVEKYENLLLYYEKKLKDTKMIKQVAGNSAKTIIYLKNSLSVSKQQMEKLKQKLKCNEEHKKSLENELLVNRIRIKELEDKYVTSSNANSASENDDANHFRLKIKCKSLLKDKEKLEIEKLDNIDNIEAYRLEIYKLRNIRDRLIEMKCKYSSKKMSSMENERDLMLISEYVETIDAMIEQKNVMICGKSIYYNNKSTGFDEHAPIRKRLEKLSQPELITLFYKYFHKVIDLKDSSKNLEIQNAILEETLKRHQIENDTRMIMLQKAYERQISLLLNYYAEETSSSSYDNKFDNSRDIERLIKENQALRTRLAHFNSLLKNAGTAQPVCSDMVRNTKQIMNPEMMQVALPSKNNKSTKVIRQGNKLIIQTNKKKK